MLSQILSREAKPLRKSQILRELQAKLQKWSVTKVSIIAGWQEITQEEFELQRQVEVWPLGTCLHECSRWP